MSGGKGQSTGDSNGRGTGRIIPTHVEDPHKLTTPTADALGSELNTSSDAPKASEISLTHQTERTSVRAVVSGLAEEVKLAREDPTREQIEARRLERRIEKSQRFNPDAPTEHSPKSNRLKPQTLSGIPDLLPYQAAKMLFLASTVSDAYQSMGSLLRVQPLMERTETIDQAKVAQGFEGEGMSDTQRFRFEARSSGGGSSNSEGWFALRVDHTLGLARYIAQHLGDLTIPFKTHSIGTVFRGERPQKGRLRAFEQADIDHIGTSELFADAEIISSLYKALKNAIPNVKFTIKLNHRSVINGFLDALDIPKDLQIAVLRAIDKLDDEEDMVQQLTVAPAVGSEMSEPAIGITDHQARALIKFLKPNFCKTMTALELLEGASQLKDENPEIEKGFKELEEIARYLQVMDVDDDSLRIDFSTIRGLDYYSGSVFEITIDGLESIGSIGGGGRYDKLTGAYMESPLPGVGGSLGLSRILAALEELDKRRWDAAFPELTNLTDDKRAHKIEDWKRDKSNPKRLESIQKLESEDFVPKNLAQADAMIVRYPDADVFEVAKLMTQLRAQGLKVIVHPGAMSEKGMNPRDQMFFASRTNASFLIFCGGEEMASGVINVKYGATREQQQFVSPAAAVAHIHGLLAQEKKIH